jgi:ABC-type branched-subunit amino acid transport system substrate-binding protein
LVVNTADDDAYVAPVAQQMASIISKSDKTVIGILGWQTSIRTESMLTDLKNDNITIPMVSQTASSDHLAEEHWNNLFQIAALNNAQAQAVVVQTKKLHATKAIVFMDQGEPYSQNLGQDFKQDFEQNFSSSPPPLEEDFKVEGTSITQFSQLLKDGLKKVNYTPGTQGTVVFFTGTTNRDVGRFQDALALASYRGLQVIAGDAGYVAHPSTHGRWYFVAYAYHDEWSTLMGTTHRFLGEYSDNFDPDKHGENDYGNGIPDAVAIISYDAANILLQGIEIAHSKGAANLTSLGLQAGLEAISSSNAWQGVSGKIAFDANHVAIDKALITLWVNPDGYIKMLCIQGNFASTVSSGLARC